MDDYRHHVSGFFPHRDKADSTLATLLEHGIPSAQLQIFVDAGQVPPAPAPQRKSNGVLKDMLVDGAIGTAVGGGLAGLASIGLAAANVSLFIASPLLAPLMLFGGGASLGGFFGAVVGASAGAGDHQGRFADLISTAIKAGDVVLVAETFSAKQTAIAREVIAAAVGEYKDLSLA
ncbi:MAG: hypothetical protein Q8R10_19865 [Pseudomonas sp.]|uniref:hypothetical protein n=1 Tax=Pseudomonas sp. TaxID=306 RepID=UPI002736FAE6|nr:hypothetical protein [Pseudomonas sp.]MDP3848681.1 hypothetical protein [Pseudomonas sp.]